MVLEAATEKDQIDQALTSMIASFFYHCSEAFNRLNC